jgi:hypothetical protein
MKKIYSWLIIKIQKLFRRKLIQQPYSICILCDCQREYKKRKGDIRLDGFDFSKFNVRMDIMIPELQRELKKYYQDILKDIDHISFTIFHLS